MLCAERLRKSHNRTSRARCEFKELRAHTHEGLDRLHKKKKNGGEAGAEVPQACRKQGAFTLLFFSVVQPNRTKTKIKRIDKSLGKMGLLREVSFLFLSFFFCFLSIYVPIILIAPTCFATRIGASPAAVFKVCSHLCRVGTCLFSRFNACVWDVSLSLCFPSFTCFLLYLP